MLTITDQILFTIKKNSNKMLFDVNTVVKEPIEHKITKKEIKQSY